MSLPIVIIGAGLAGLNCARLLHEQARRFLLIDANSRIGGRVQTDIVDGFQLDHGFQVFQTVYPEAKLALDYANLHLTKLETGALIRHRGAWVRMADPWRQPQHALTTLFNSVGNVADRFRLFQLRRHVLSKSPDELLSATNDCTTREYLLGHWRFSQAFYDLFLKPWWSGIFLEPELKTSAAYFQFVFHMLAAGDVALPRSGMQAIPNQLASKLPQDSIRLAARVTRIHNREVQLSTGEVIAARAVVLATDNASAAQLTAAQLTATQADRIQPRAWSSTICMYFAADRPPSNSKLLMLLADPVGPANHVFIPSNSVANFAPAGKSLISVSLVNPSESAESLMPTVLQQLRELFGSQVDSWRPLRTYTIPHALPVQPAGFHQDRSLTLSDGTILCGDHLETSSIQGALVSGRKAAVLAASC
ncbi:MAG: NAD(P)/FAD-dependent oxidoreductase [Pirellulaceae bacterium]|nr:NAD(P)/FAD-dependent oxidoreductase [Pirellulaceae bacterium]